MERVSQRELYVKGGITKWYWDFRDRAVLRHTAKAQSVLDIGCGEGITLERLHDQVHRRKVLGIDCDKKNVKVCRDRGLSANEWDVYKLTDLLFGEDWECCLLLDVIEHLADPGRALRNIHQVLKTGGTLLIMFPNDLMFFAARLAFLKFKAAFADSGHLWKFKPGVMADILQEMGFEIESTECLPWKWFPLHHLIVARKI